MKQKKILELCLSPNLGGLELCVSEYFKYFKTLSNSVLVVSPDTKLDESIKDENKYTLKRNKFFPILPAFQLANLIDDKEIDVIHFHWGADTLVSVLAKIMSKRKPQIVLSRHMHMSNSKNDFYHKWVYSHIDMIHAVTNRVQEQLSKYIPKEVLAPVNMVYHGVSELKLDDKKIKELKSNYSLDSYFTVGIVGRIEEDKGQNLLIEAIYQLKNLNIKVLIVGHTMDEAYLKSLKEKVKTLNLQDRIIFTGFTKEVNQHIKLCDTVVLATKKETFGLVIIESMINSVCAIATNSGGPLEIIDDNENGLLFEWNYEDLAAKIKYLYDNPQVKESLALAGYEKVKKYLNKDIQNKKLYDLIQKC